MGLGDSLAIIINNITLAIIIVMLTVDTIVAPLSGAVFQTCLVALHIVCLKQIARTRAIPSSSYSTCAIQSADPAAQH